MHKKKNKSHQFRLSIVFLCFFSVLMILGWRITDLMIWHRAFLKGQGEARSLRTQTISAYRGMITDRHGLPLAISTPVTAIWVDPRSFDPTIGQLKQLAHLLHWPVQKLKSYTVNAPNKREFVYLKRQLTPDIAQRFADLHIKGLNFQQEFKRFYPERESMAQLLGFTNIDDKGIEGLELAYQDWLAGVSGKKKILKDRTGRIIKELGVVKPPHAGHDLRLSVDNRIQYFAYQELQKTVKKFAAKAGSVVVLDSQTGEILAVANYPSFNPNARSAYTKACYRNKAITDVFEPGSVIKPFTIASALSTGLITPTTVFDTNPSWMMVNHRTIRDVRNYGVLDVTGILQHSSNVGVTKMTLMSPPNQLIDLLHRSGFGERTDSNYPGEADGMIVKVRDANPFVLATLSFGYGMSTTALQLAQAYAIFANDGQLIPVSLLYRHQALHKKTVMPKKTAHQVLAMLEAVLAQEGTGKSARIAGYRVAGKTGTVRLAGKKGYEKNRHSGSFVGIAPVSKPRLVVVVMIHEPRQGGYYGAIVAGPLFAKVMAHSLRLLNILPDKLPENI